MLKVIVLEECECCGVIELASECVSVCVCVLCTGKVIPWWTAGHFTAVEWDRCTVSDIAACRRSAGNSKKTIRATPSKYCVFLFDEVLATQLPHKSTLRRSMHTHTLSNYINLVVIQGWLQHMWSRFPSPGETCTWPKLTGRQQCSDYKPSWCRCAAERMLDVLKVWLKLFYWDQDCYIYPVLWYWEKIMIVC